MNVFTAALGGHVKSECERLRRGQEQSRGKKPVALVKLRNRVFRSRNMDGHRVVTQVESARLADSRCGPGVLDISGCTGDHCDGPGCVMDTSVDVIGTGDRPDSSCHGLSHGQVVTQGCPLVTDQMVTVMSRVVRMVTLVQCRTCTLVCVPGKGVRCHGWASEEPGDYTEGYWSFSVFDVV